MDQDSPPNPLEVVETLAQCRQPHLIGVRHHSAALARTMEQVLERINPATILLEMPTDFEPWLPYLADQDTVAPIALSAATEDGSLCFYPLADFSPELVAIRWARKHQRTIVPFDLAIGVQLKLAAQELLERYHSPCSNPGLLEALLRQAQANDSGQLWERLVESPSMGQDPEATRRAGLLFGWAVRTNSRQPTPRDLLREAIMRHTLRQKQAEAQSEIVAIVGAFHAPALVPDTVQQHEQLDAEVLASLEFSNHVGISLIPYGFEQLDERSGYPAGIRDPIWHQRMFEATAPHTMDATTVEMVVQICRSLRQQGHVAGTPDATEVIRMMRDLARMRGLPTAGRSELHEALQTCLTHGELNGRARAVARAAETTLVGQRQGRVAAHTPRCGLLVSLEQQLRELRMPGPEKTCVKPDDLTEIRLDPLHSVNDRTKAVVLRRLKILGVPYAERVDSVAIGQRENLGERWRIGWRQSTSATLESLARFGVTLTQVVAGTLRLQFQTEHALTTTTNTTTTNTADEMIPARRLERLEAAAEAGIGDLLNTDLLALSGTFCQIAGLLELVKAMSLLKRIAAGHIPALPLSPSDANPPIMLCFDPTPYRNTPEQLLEAALQRLDGVVGSDQVTDVIGVCDLAHWFNDDPMNANRLISWCQRTLQAGSDMMRGVAAGVLALFQQFDHTQVAMLLESWFDRATDREGRQHLRNRLLGLTQALFPQMISDSNWLAGLESRLQNRNDTEFLSRLPALRGAFQHFSPADRQRLLRLRLESYTERGSDIQANSTLTELPLDRGLWFAMLRNSDLQGREALRQCLPEWIPEFARADFPDATPTFDLQNTGATESSAITTAGPPSVEAKSRSRHAVIDQTRLQIPIADRWRMILGIPPESSAPVCRAAARLDDLYGHGKGEGARDRIGNRAPGTGTGGGTEAPAPQALEWSDDIEQLFGADVCQEVLGEATERGNLAAAERLDPDRVQPSIELLRQVLALAGSLPEQRAQKLRRLAKRITAALAKQLAVRLQPAMHGLNSPRPTRRKGRKLHLHRTIRDNLANVYRRDNNRPGLIAKRLVFQATSRREMDWHLIFVVDVSGSMSASVIYSAICAAIFSELPALSVRFLAFSTEVVDLSEKVTDPLTLLLEVQIGGGTRIGMGLAAARKVVKIPQRTLLVLVSDFEEGVSLGEMLSEIRELCNSGVRCLGLAALDDSGTARFHQGYAGMAAAVGMSVAAVSPEQLARWVGDQIRSTGQGTSAPTVRGVV